MESTDGNLPDAEFEFSQEELEEALKPKPGRPSNRIRELRENIKDAQRLTSILGILDSGILERLTDGFNQGFGQSVPQRDTGVESPTKQKAGQNVPDGFTEELLLNLKLINPKFAKTNRKILGLTDEVVGNAMIRYGPLAAVVAALWVAEGQIKDFPQTLHTGLALLTKLLRLVDILGNFIGDGLGGITDFIKDPVDTVRVALGGARITDIRNLDTLTPEEQQIFFNTPIGRQVCSLTSEQQIEIFGKVICGASM